MILKRKSFLDKKNYELSGQQFFFDRYNLAFKAINLPKPQHYDSLFKKFRIKKIKTKIFFPLPKIMIAE
tara:strand:+ start:636 stop:842 length:207 start_codon:yes stop_codon:yes gene_type:complete